MRLEQPYRPGVRARHKLRARVTAEAVVGCAIGQADAPRELILGRFDDSGRLRIAGRSTRLSPTASAQLAAVQERARGSPRSVRRRVSRRRAYGRRRLDNPRRRCGGRGRSGWPGGRSWSRHRSIFR